MKLWRLEMLAAVVLVLVGVVGVVLRVVGGAIRWLGDRTLEVWQLTETAQMRGERRRQNVGRGNIEEPEMAKGSPPKSIPATNRCRDLMQRHQSIRYRTPRNTPLGFRALTCNPSCLIGHLQPL